MRLINTKTLKLEEFDQYNTPDYAILSHTWGDDVEELTFRDVEAGMVDKPGVGSVKFRGSCQQAVKDGLGYVWIDTCCIDKGNLVELSEAINSMFRWYKSASFCYVYLADVPKDDTPRKNNSKFAASRWFTRGWTLQELLAPKYVRFYNSSWSLLGNKGTMPSVLENVTGIPRQFLLGIVELQSASVAQRMSWAATRQTKRPEDLAYCLLGIFGITMPMIYGEGGDQAFLRLQEQIMRTTRDDSMLAWGLGGMKASSLDSTPAPQAPGRALAGSPSDFSGSGNIVSWEKSTISPNLNALQLSGGSLRVYLPLVATSDQQFVGLLSCGPNNNTPQRVGIPLVKVVSGTDDEYMRPKGANAELHAVIAPPPSPRLIYINNDGIPHDMPADGNRFYWFFDHESFAELGLELMEVHPTSSWDQERGIISSLQTSADNNTRHILARLCHSSEELGRGGGHADFVLLLDLTDLPLTPEAKPQCHLMICSRDASLGEIASNQKFLAQRASGKASASNGHLHLQVISSPENGPSMFTIKPEVLAHAPPVTVNAATETSKLNLVTKLNDIWKKRTGVRHQLTEMQTATAGKRDRLAQIKVESEAVEEELRRLETRKAELAEEKEREIMELKELQLQQTVAKRKRAYLAEERSRTQEQWYKICGIERRESLFDLDYRSPLRWAAGNNCFEMVEFILCSAAGQLFPQEEIDSSLIEACYRGYDPIVQVLLGQGVDPNIKEESAGRTALAVACYEGNTSTVEILLKTGKVDVNSRDNDNWTPLGLAIKQGHLGIAELLLENNADDTAVLQDPGIEIPDATGANNIPTLILMLRDRIKYGNSTTTTTTEKVGSDSQKEATIAIDKEEFDPQTERDNQPAPSLQGLPSPLAPFGQQQAARSNGKSQLAYPISHHPKSGNMESTSSPSPWPFGLQTGSPSGGWASILSSGKSHWGTSKGVDETILWKFGNSSFYNPQTGHRPGFFNRFNLLSSKPFPGTPFYTDIFAEQAQARVDDYSGEKCVGTGSVTYHPYRGRETYNSEIEEVSTHISSSDEFSNWSPEELRLADYACGKTKG
ncbi:hypothetical protein QBC43DRAFT_306491 [Cladorrhinum sp. PSN259]|nr:hypothetical protein QBC43DRAFT_306491 [Cladorrhinum sp. PSN259]